MYKGVHGYTGCSTGVQENTGYTRVHTGCTSICTKVYAVYKSTQGIKGHYTQMY